MKLAYDFAIVGDDKPVALIARPEIADLVAEPDPAKRLATYTALVVAIIAASPRSGEPWRVPRLATPRRADSTSQWFASGGGQ